MAHGCILGLGDRLVVSTKSPRTGEFVFTFGRAYMNVVKYLVISPRRVSPCWSSVWFKF